MARSQYATHYGPRSGFPFYDPPAPFSLPTMVHVQVFRFMTRQPPSPYPLWSTFRLSVLWPASSLLPTHYGSRSGFPFYDPPAPFSLPTMVHVQAFRFMTRQLPSPYPLWSTFRLSVLWPASSLLPTHYGPRSGFPFYDPPAPFSLPTMVHVQAFRFMTRQLPSPYPLWSTFRLSVLWPASSLLPTHYGPRLGFPFYDPPAPFSLPTMVHV